MRKISALLAVVGMSAASQSAQADTLIVPVAQDITVNAANDDSNLNAVTTRGGLLSGLDDTGSEYHFFLQFNLPAFQADTSIVSAILRGQYTDDFGGPDSFHAFRFVPDDAWSETTVTFNNKPADTGDPLAGFEAGQFTPPAAVAFDLMSIVQQEYAGDGVLSLSVSTIDGRFGDLEFFASKEFNSGQAFRLEIITAPVASVPLPAGWGMIASAMPMAILMAKRIRPGMRVSHRS